MTIAAEADVLEPVQVSVFEGNFTQPGQHRSINSASDLLIAWPTGREQATMEHPRPGSTDCVNGHECETVSLNGSIEAGGARLSLGERREIRWIDPIVGPDRHDPLGTVIDCELEPVVELPPQPKVVLRDRRKAEIPRNPDVLVVRDNYALCMNAVAGELVDYTSTLLEADSGKVKAAIGWRYEPKRHVLHESDIVWRIVDIRVRGQELPLPRGSSASGLNEC
jgi:hypothetical protein